MNNIDDLRRDYDILERKIDALELERDKLYAMLKAGFRDEFGRLPETADDHFYLRGGPKPRK